MKLVCLSDTHGFHEQLRVPKGDVLIHTGDCTRRGRPDEIRRFERWFAGRPHPHKLLVPGNHEVGWDDPRRLDGLRRRFSEGGIRILHDDRCVLGGLTFYGTAWQPRFGEWAFNVPRGEDLRKKYAKIPAETDVLMTHSPPLGILDRTPTRRHVGARTLRERVQAVHPRVHLFGHIHNAHGLERRRNTTFVNGAVCDEAGQPRHAPIGLTLPPGDPARPVQQHQRRPGPFPGNR